MCTQKVFTRRASAKVKAECSLSVAVKKEKQGTLLTAEVKAEKKKSQSSQSSAPATAQSKKMKQPTIERALRRAETKRAIEAAPKRRRTGITPDSCGKPGDPHNLETGALVARSGHISKARRAALDAGWDAVAQQAGESDRHPVDLD